MIGLGGYARAQGVAPTPDTQHFVFGRRSFFGYLVRADGEIYWFANVTRPEPARGRATSEDWLELLRELHADDPPPIPQIVAGNVGELRGYPIYDLAHVPRWGRGRAVAAGDAVHGTSPSIGQGASLAFEDAIVLAKCLRDLPDSGQAFATYQRLRQPPAERLVAYAQEVNKYKRISPNPLAVRMRGRARAAIPAHGRQRHHQRLDLRLPRHMGDADRGAGACRGVTPCAFPQRSPAADKMGKLVLTENVSLAAGLCAGDDRAAVTLPSPSARRPPRSAVGEIRGDRWISRRRPDPCWKPQLVRPRVARKDRAPRYADGPYP
jgi:hypothetical protein